MGKPKKDGLEAAKQQQEESAQKEDNQRNLLAIATDLETLLLEADSYVNAKIEEFKSEYSESSRYPLIDKLTEFNGIIGRTRANLQAMKCFTIGTAIKRCKELDQKFERPMADF